jgi:hypothetical protein
MAFRLKEHSDAYKVLIFGVIWRTRELIEQGANHSCGCFFAAFFRRRGTSEAAMRRLTSLNRRTSVSHNEVVGGAFRSGD